MLLDAPIHRLEGLEGPLNHQRDKKREQLNKNI